MKQPYLTDSFQVVRPMRKVLASGGRVASSSNVSASGGRSANTPSSASSHSGSSSTKLMKSRSRLDIPGARKEGVPSNMVGKVLSNDMFLALT